MSAKIHKYQQIRLLGDKIYLFNVIPIMNELRKHGPCLSTINYIKKTKFQRLQNLTAHTLFSCWQLFTCTQHVVSK